MWLERYVIVITSLHRDFIPAAWGMYHGTFWDYATYYGTIGLFFFADVPVHPGPAGDLDRRDAGAGGGDAGAAPRPPSRPEAGLVSVEVLTR